MNIDARMSSCRRVVLGSGSASERDMYVSLYLSKCWGYVLLSFRCISIMLNTRYVRTQNTEFMHNLSIPSVDTMFPSP